MNQTFPRFKQAHPRCSMQDPVDGRLVPLTQYEEIYGAVLNQLDGSDMIGYVTFFFECSPLNESNWEFVDADAQSDFLEWAVDLCCIPSLKTLQRGDDYECCKVKHPAQQQRQSKEEQRKRQQGKRRTANAHPSQEKLLQCLLQSQKKIKSSMEGAGESETVRLEKKLQRVETRIKGLRTTAPNI